MAAIAKKQLYTSGGIVLAGQALPKLPAKEIEAIRLSGGLDEEEDAPTSGDKALVRDAASLDLGQPE
jgi:hypothetical protein